MRAKRVFLAAIGFALLALSWPAAPGLAAEWEGTQEREAVLGLSRAFRAAAEYGIPRTVCIRIRLGDKEGFGSGAIVSPRGHILTCAHVAEPGQSLEVITHDGRVLPARKLGMNSRNDYAVIQAEARDLPYFRLGSSAALKPGDWVLALGHPGGPYADFRPALAAGRITGLHRKLPVQFNVKYYDDALQTDAPIFAGNSGGPLMNPAGELVGINGAILLINENAYATPIDEIALELERLKAGQSVAGRAPTDTMKVLRDLTSEIDPKDLEKMYAKSSLGKVLGPLLKGLGGGGDDRAAAERRERMKAFGRDGVLRAAFGPLEEGLRRSVVRVWADGEAAGYGVVLTAEGTALTCDRVLGYPARRIRVEANGVTRAANVIGRNGQLEVALLRFDPRDMNLEPAAVGDSAALAPGDWAVSMGTDGPVGVGVVGAVRRRVEGDRRIPTMGIFGMLGTPNESPIRPYEEVLQHDALVAKGQFGSPVFDGEGRWVGVNVGHFYRGSSYAVPAAALVPALEALRSGRTVEPPPYTAAEVEEAGGFDSLWKEGGLDSMFEELRKMLEQLLNPGGEEEAAPKGAWLGVVGEDAEGGGVRVREVVEGSPAAAAGLRAGDVIAAFGGKPLDGFEDLRGRVAAGKAGDRVALRLLRAGKAVEVRAVLGERP